MTNDTVFVVTFDGDNVGGRYPYGVFTNEQAARQAREAIITELDDTERDMLDDEEQSTLQDLVPTLDKQIYIEECELRSEFSGDELQELFEDV